MGDSGQVSSSSYLIACDETERERQKELLYKVMGPVFFGQKAAENDSELAELFRSRYGIDVQRDFYEGDEHYEEYLEAQQAIAEGMSIYGGEIAWRKRPGRACGGSIRCWKSEPEESGLWDPGKLRSGSLLLILQEIYDTRIASHFVLSQS